MEDQTSPDDVASEATEAEAAAPAPAPASDKRAPRTDLEGDLKGVLDDYVTGKIVVPNNKPLTPYAISKIIGERRGGRVPSVGAVSAALARWVKIGFITLTDASPIAFVDYTEAGRTEGLSALKAKYREDRKAARAAEKAAQAPAAAPAAPTNDNADDTEGEEPSAPF